MVILKDIWKSVKRC